MKADFGGISIKAPDWRSLWEANKLPFLTALVTGLLSYGYIMLNRINNHDSVAIFNGYGTGLPSGRWSLELIAGAVEKLWGNFNLPLFCGFAAVLLLAVSACVIIRMLGIRPALAQAACSAVFTAFPAMGSTMLYIYTAHYYAFAVLLAVTGAWLSERYRLGFLPAAVLFAVSLGIYQAYIPLAAALMVLALFRRCGREDAAGAVFTAALRDLAALALGAVLYVLILWAALRISHVQLNGYRGIGDTAALIGALPQMVVEAYRQFFLLPFRVQLDVNYTGVIRLVMGLCLAAGYFGAAMWLARSGAGRGRKALGALFLALLPLAVDSVYILCATSWVEAMLCYGTVTVFFFPMVTLQSWEETGALLPGRRLLPGVLSAAVLLAAVNYGWQANGVYVTQELTNWQTKMYFETALTRLKSAEGYRPELKLAVIGENIWDGAYWNFAYEQGTPFRFRGMHENELNEYSRDRWLQYYFGFGQPQATEEETAALAVQEEVQAMPCYPADGSIRVLDGYLVLKLEDTYLS